MGEPSLGMQTNKEGLNIHANHQINVFHQMGPLVTARRALAGEDPPTVMQRTFWKKPSTAWRYLRLMEVLISGSVRNSTVSRVSPEQYR